MASKRRFLLFEPNDMLTPRRRFALFGIFGVASIFPNLLILVMGSTTDKNADLAKIPLTGSALMIASSVLGVLHHPKYLPMRIACYTGGAGLVYQFGPFLTFLIPGFNKCIDNRYYKKDD
jgi:peptidoglycan/LPS O-acetylase OafA/YrhL